MPETLPLKRGDIYLANLDPVIGRETGKTRPVLFQALKKKGKSVRGKLDFLEKVYKESVKS